MEGKHAYVYSPGMDFGDFAGTLACVYSGPAVKAVFSALEAGQRPATAREVTGRFTEYADLGSLLGDFDMGHVLDGAHDINEALAEIVAGHGIGGAWALPGGGALVDDGRR